METETASGEVSPLSRSSICVSCCSGEHVDCVQTPVGWTDRPPECRAAFVFSLLETYLALHPSHSVYLFEKFSTLLPLLTACGFEPIVWEDFWEPLRDLLWKMGPEAKDGGKREDGEPRLTREGLFTAFNDQETNRCGRLDLTVTTDHVRPFVKPATDSELPSTAAAVSSSSSA